MSEQVSVSYVQQVKLQVCAQFDVPLTDLMSPSREARVVQARHLAMWLVRKHWSDPPMSYPSIARAFGRKDHTTAIHAVRKMEKLMVAGTYEAPPLAELPPLPIGPEGKQWNGVAWVSA
jgi:chromosomal replication initiator protein